MMKKFFIFMLTILTSVGMSGHTTDAHDNWQVNWNDSIDYYIMKVREGNPQAYLRLAECYRQSEENLEYRVTKMAMIGNLAEEYGVVKGLEDLFADIPENDPTKWFFNIFRAIAEKEYDKAHAYDKELLEIGSSPEIIDVFIAISKREGNDVLNLLSSPTLRNNTLAQFFLVLLHADEGPTKIDLEIAKKYPIQYNDLARNCFQSEVSAEEDERAAVFYRMAYEQACLDLTGAKWLSSYYEHMLKRDGKIIVAGTEIDSKETEGVRRLASHEIRR